MDKRQTIGEKLQEMIKTELQGLPLLNGDIEHVWRNIQGLGVIEIKALLQRYRKIWEEKSMAEQNKIHKDNAGRRAANLWILNQASKDRDEEDKQT